jgi:cysteine-rich repeat protein
VIQGEETCDDGNEADGDGCSDCLVDEGHLCSDEPSVCGLQCDPLLQDCVEGEACYPIPAGSICLGQGSGAQGDACMSIDGCAPGFACLDGGGCMADACCASLCDLSGGAVCPSMELCVAWYGAGMAPPGYENVGVCAGA